MNSSTLNTPAWRAVIVSVNGFCSPSFVRWPDSHPVNGKKAHCTATIPVNGNSPLTRRPLVTAWRCRSHILSPVTESGRNGGGHEYCSTHLLIRLSPL